jgi:hypothetical protein
MARLRRRFGALGLVGLMLAACSPTVVVPPGPVLDIPEGLHPRLTVADVSAIVIGQIHSMETIAGRVLRPPRILRITANRGGQAAPGFDPVTWIVKAEGTFATNRGGPSGGAIPAAPTGQFEIADADGSILGFGFP